MTSDRIKQYWNLQRKWALKWLVDEKGFNPKYAPLAWDNFVSTMAYAGMAPKWAPALDKAIEKELAKCPVHVPGHHQ